MKVETLKTKIKSVENILHFSDVHIRLLTRHDEYREVFKKLYVEVGKLNENSIVIFSGDLGHSKCVNSPEYILLASELLRNIANIRPLIIISGNHDALLNNKNRLDSITPVVESLSHNNIYYLRDSGLYSFSDILFNNLSVFDDNHIKTNDIPFVTKSCYKKVVCLFHGPIYSMATDIGYQIADKTNTCEKFDGSDIAICGDIHRAQTVYIEKLIHPELGQLEYDKLTQSDEWELTGDETEEGFQRIRKKHPIIRQAGSLIQQDHGERLNGHGYTLWNMSDCSHKHIEIPNDCGFFTIDVKEGKIESDLKEMPMQVRLRVNHKDTTEADLKEVISTLKQKYTLLDVIQVRLSANTSAKVSMKQAFDAEDLDNVSYQNKLIKEYVKKELGITDENIIQLVLDLNKKLNNEIVKTDLVARNIKWIPKRFEFSNLFSYGENNVIDFTKMNGVMGLFATNRAGKSSILEALSFCIFDKSSKTHLPAVIMNHKKSEMKSKFIFEINGVEYKIERNGTRDKKGSISIKLSFKKYVDGKEIDLEGEQRNATNEIIRKYFGTHDDFLLTILSIQGSKAKNAVDLGQSERKDLLCNFAGINIFESLSELATNQSRDASVKLKLFNKETFEQKLADLNIEFENRESKHIEISDKLKLFENELSNLNEEKLKLTKQIIQLGDIPTNIELIKGNVVRIKTTIQTNKNRLVEIESQLISGQNKITEIEKLLKEFNDKNVDKKYQEYLSQKKRLNEITNQVERMKILVKGKFDKLEHLSKHEYDPNCKFCTNNVFVKDAENTKTEIEADKIEFRKITTERDKLSSTIDESIVQDYESLKQTKERENVVVRSNSKLESEKNTLNIDRLESDLEKCEADIIRYEKSKESIEFNKTIESQISKSQLEINNQKVKVNSINKELMENHSRLTSIKDQKVEIDNKIDVARKLETENLVYELYLKAVNNKNGIPYNLISKLLPTIQEEVNNILVQVCDFTVTLEADGKNININICEDGFSWPVEVTSGMEKFIISLAIRVGLTSISNMPRSNFICIDEGFGTLAPEHLSSMPILFNFLKTQYDFVVIVSHLDQMKDYVDGLIEIQKIDGVTNVNFV